MVRAIPNSVFQGRQRGGGYRPVFRGQITTAPELSAHRRPLMWAHLAYEPTPAPAYDTEPPETFFWED